MRKLLSVGVVVAAVLAVVTPVVTNVGAQAAPSTVVVLSFDEGWANQLAAQTLLDAHGMKGNFYVNSGNVDQGGFLSWKDLLALQAGGHEIGGETLSYVNVNTAPDAQTQVCEDRARLLKHGLQAFDFAYPGGQYYQTPEVLAMLQDCGYRSGRSQFGLYNPNVTDCPFNDGCGFPDTQPIPPADAYAIKAARNVDGTTTLSDLEGYVTRAEQANGGLVPIVFHQICDNNCDTYSTSTTILDDFLTWLQARANSGTVVQTMHQVIGGSLAASPGTADTTAPVSVIYCNAAACSNGLNVGTVSVNLGGQDEDLGSGLDAVRYTLDGSEPTLSSSMYTAPFVVSTNTTIKYAAYDNAGNREATNTQKVLFTDNVAPVTTVTCNGAPCGSWYHGPVSVALASTDDGVGVSSIRYTTNGFDPTPGSLQYTTPVVISADTTLKYRAYDGASNAETVHTLALQFEGTAPTSALTCNGAACSAGWYRGSVSIALSGADTGGSGLAGIHYTLDNSTPTAASPLYGAPLNLTASKWVKLLAVDNAGNAGTVTTTLVHIDTTAPVVAIKPPANNAKVAGIVKITIKTSDAKSGVAKIAFSIDGHHITSVTKPALSLNWNTAKVKKGKHTLTAKVTDKAGNLTTKSISVVR